MNKITIVLAADVRYAEQVITTVKSICLHHRRVKFYLLNEDYASQWFDEINQQLAAFDSQMIDCKVNNEDVKNYRTLAHISSSSTYFRYFIPELIDENRVLYLDCDLVVNQNLQVLFDLDMQGYPIAACLDIIDFHRSGLSEFNAGVMLIDNQTWKREQATSRLLSLSDRYANQAPCGDQSILNMLFQNRWLSLHRTFNYQVGSDWVFRSMGRYDWIEDLHDKIPAIVHYTTQQKPWLHPYQPRFHSLYWWYYRLSWQRLQQLNNIGLDS